MERARLHHLMPKFSPTDNKDMASPLAEQIALLLNQKPNQVERSIEQIVHDIRTQLAEFGEVHIDGLGVFRSTNGDMSFDPDPTIVDIVNPEYAVLEPLQVEVTKVSLTAHPPYVNEAPAQPVLLTPDAGDESEPEPAEAFGEPAAVVTDAGDRGPGDPTTDDQAPDDLVLDDLVLDDQNPVVLLPDDSVSNGEGLDDQPPDEPEEVTAGFSEAGSEESIDPEDEPPTEPMIDAVGSEHLDFGTEKPPGSPVAPIEEAEYPVPSPPDREDPRVNEETGEDEALNDEAEPSPDRHLAIVDEEADDPPTEGGDRKAPRSRGAAVLIVDPDVSQPGERLNNAAAFQFATEPEARKQRIRSRREESLQVRNGYIWVLGTVGVFLLVYTIYLITSRFSGSDAPPVAAETTRPVISQAPPEAESASLPGEEEAGPAVSVGPVTGAEATETPPASNDSAPESSEETTPVEQAASAEEQASVVPPTTASSGLTRTEGAFALIVVSTPSQREAQTVLRRYEAAGLQGELLEARVRGQTYYRVAIGGYSSLQAARADLSQLPAFAPSDAWATQVR